MPAKKSAVPAEIYQIKVTLLGTSPPIWRRLLVPADPTLEQLHDVLQAAMGWEDEPTLPSMPERRTVRSFSAEVKAIYTYDFGDTWEHGIVLEKRLPVDPNMAYPVCTDGRLACPPEDCGGIPGFYDLVEALNDPNHERHEEMRDWIGDDFDPQAFSVERVNRLLTPLHRRGKAPKS